MVARMAARWGKDGPPVAVVNTDAQALASCAVDRVYLIGEQTTQRMGAGGDPEAGRLAAEERSGEVASWVTGHDLVFLVTGLGGGTGTGAAPVLAREIHKAGGLCLAFASLPFVFEGDRRQRTAMEGLRLLQHSADAVVALPNEKLIDLIDRDAGLVATFEASDHQISACIYTIWKLLSEPGVINLDFADIRQLVEVSRGACAYGYGEGSGKSRTADALQALLNSPWLEKGRLLTESNGLLVNILGGPDITLSDVQGVVGEITAKLPKKAKVFTGASILPSWRDRIAITVIAAEASLGRKATTVRDEVEPEPGPPEKPATKSGTVKEPQDLVQASLPLEDAEKHLERFKSTTATIVNGQNLDIPTYIRRSVKLSFER